MTETTNQAVTFVLLREGTSDDALVGVIEDLIVRAGATEAVGVAEIHTGAVEEKLRETLKSGATVDLIFVHRDADGPDPEERRREVSTALARLGLHGVPVVPVQATEAWLLVSESEIRAVCGRPSGRKPLGLPALGRIERTRNPKDVLKEALRLAAANTGRRRRADNREFGHRRRSLLERLDIDGPVRELMSFRRLVDDTTDAVKTILDTRSQLGEEVH